MAEINPSTTSFTEADGRQLAIDMLRELKGWAEQIDARECEKIDQGGEMPDMREVMLGEEPEILRRYLAAIGRMQSPVLERGFLCVLSQSLVECTQELDDYADPRPGLAWEL
jgi:hypothetical protein